MFETRTLPIRSRRPGGFTLVELLVTIAMLGVLASLAAPSFADMLRRMRVESMREEMLASIAHARVEAISRGRPVVLLRTAPCPQAANALDWDCGWTAFIDLNGNDTINAGEPVLHVVQGKPGIRLRQNPDASIATIDRFGRSPIASFQIFPAGGVFGPADGVGLCAARNGHVHNCAP